MDLNKIWQILGTIGAVIGMVWGWIERNKEKIAALIKRVEADIASSGGEWTLEAKQKLAWDLFKLEIYPTLPWFLKMLPDSLIKSKLDAIIKRICQRAKEMINSSKLIMSAGGK